MKLATASALLATSASAKVFFHEKFDSMDKWVASDATEGLGKFELSSGKFSGDAKINQGLRSTEDAKFYGAATEIAEGVQNKDKDLVVSMSVKHEQGIGCGGGYIKIGPQMDLKKLNGDSEYFLMFGPDKCGSTNKVHVIFGGYKKADNNLLWKKSPSFPTDKNTHVYTLVVKPDLSYELFVDQESKEKGTLPEDWEFLKPKEIDDPSDKKPEDWVDEAQMDDPEDKKPEDWDNQPEKIKDPEATKPEDWDEEDDGEWEAPEIANPEYKGAWRAKRIANPAYKGVWKAKLIANPEFVDDKEMYYPKSPLKWVGIDVWQVESGSIWDNIIIGDDLAEVNAIVDATWGATKEAEMTARKAAEEAAEAAAKPAKEEKEAEDEEDEEEL